MPSQTSAGPAVPLIKKSRPPRKGPMPQALLSAVSISINRLPDIIPPLHEKLFYAAGWLRSKSVSLSGRGLTGFEAYVTLARKRHVASGQRNTAAGRSLVNVPDESRRQPRRGAYHGDPE